MKIRNIETLFCDAGWRPWIFVKVTTEEGITGYSECSESFGSPLGIAACIEDLKKHVIGLDPRAHEYIYWVLYRLTRQSPGSVIHKAIAGIENALIDIKAKALGIPVYELFGGPLRESIPLYWSHCGTTRMRSAEFVKKPPIRSLADITALVKEVSEQGYTALKTNLLCLKDSEPSVLMQGFRGGYGSTDQNLSPRVLSQVEALIGTMRDAAGPEMGIALDLNFHFKTEGNIAVARALEPFNLMWLELDSYDPQALSQVRSSSRVTICSGEDLYTTRDYRPYFESHSMHVAAVDVIWNGIVQSKKIADMAEIYEMNVAPHNHYGHLATLIAAHFCAISPNVRIMEFDVDDVPWREELLTHPPEIFKGTLKVPKRPGWGADLNEEVIRAHPWPKK